MAGSSSDPRPHTRARGRPLTLVVIVDGAPLPDEEARTFWARFSAHMEDKRGDLAGFARSEGFASVHPEVKDGAPALVVSSTAPQRAYANAPRSGGSANASASKSGGATRSGGGSHDVHSRDRGPDRATGGSRGGAKNRGNKR